MTRQQYDDATGEIMKRLEEPYSVPEDIDRELERLKKYKPIRLRWFFAYARNQYRRSQKGGEFFSAIAGKYFPAYQYTGVPACLNLSREISKSNGNFFDVKRFNYMLRALRGDFSYYDNALKCCAEVLAEEEDQEKDFDAYRELYGCREHIGYLIHQMSRRVKFPHMQPLREFLWVDKLTNMGYLRQVIQGNDDSPFAILESEYNEPIVRLVSEDLQRLGKKVYLLKTPLKCEGSGIDIKDTLAVSLDSMESDGNIVTLVPVELVSEEGDSVDNRDYLLKYIREYFSGSGHIYILADGWLTDALERCPMVWKDMIRITPYSNDINQCNLFLCFYGSYVDYISQIYGTDCNKLLEAESSVRFSVIIPARNSADTLRHTLRTCLEQSYQGSYEIVVSDNSTEGNGAVYDLCQELNDSRIVYLKTPRDLHLPKSFEYAYLHAKGEYIFALGSDDGALPWALEALDQVIAKHPGEEVIEWERGFYAWPGFNGGQQHQFTIPRDYRKGDYNTCYCKRVEYLALILENPSSMYFLPMLYINSCFKRSYFHTLLEKTGRLWDGICQDIYIGVVTACIQPQVLIMRYPLTIAGMSAGSVGATSNAAVKDDTMLKGRLAEAQRDNNVGGFCRSYWERLLPETGTDTSSLYGSLLRAVSRGILSEEYLEKVFDWKAMFLCLFREMAINDVAYDRKIHELRYAAMKHGEEFLDWFDKTIYNSALEPRIIDERRQKELTGQRTYVCGRMPTGGLMADASLYGVKNIYDAVKLFEKLTGL